MIIIEPVVTETIEKLYEELFPGKVYAFKDWVQEGTRFKDIND